MTAKDTVWSPRREGPEPSSSGSLLGKLLWSRGIEDSKDTESFLYPKLQHLESPFRLTHLESACERIHKALQDKELIAIYGDYDIDGMSATSILKSYFSLVSERECITYIPDRFKEGYGMNPEAMKKLAEEGVDLIITVDTGITAVDAVQVANDLGMEVIVTDHHLPKEELPKASWIVNPNSGLCQSDLGYLAGSGVAFYLCMGLNVVLKREGFFEEKNLEVPRLKNFLDLYSLGTISDQMLLTGDNRTLVKAGLQQLLKSERPGLRELIRRCVDLEKKEITARDVGFSIGPKLNAASRLGFAQLSVDLLSCEDPVLARRLSEELLDLNEKRMAIQADITEEAMVQAQEQKDDARPVIVAFGEWHEGVLGIVAAKLVEEFHLPAIVLGLADGVYKGSMRSTEGFNCVDLLSACSEYLPRFGGHAGAAGLHVENGKIEDFMKKAWEVAPSFFAGQGQESKIVFDGTLPKSLSIEEIEELTLLAPFGNGNPEPLFCVENLALDRNIRILKEKHVKFKSDEGWDVIGFFKAQDFATLNERSCKSFDILVTPEINRYRGLSRIQLRLEHVRESQSPNSHS